MDAKDLPCDPRSAKRRRHCTDSVRLPQELPDIQTRGTSTRAAATRRHVTSRRRGSLGKTTTDLASGLHLHEGRHTPRKARRPAHRGAHLRRHTPIVCASIAGRLRTHQRATTIDPHLPSTGHASTHRRPAGLTPRPRSLRPERPPAGVSRRHPLATVSRSRLGPRLMHLAPCTALLSRASLANLAALHPAPADMTSTHATPLPHPGQHPCLDRMAARPAF